MTVAMEVVLEADAWSNGGSDEEVEEASFCPSRCSEPSLSDDDISVNDADNDEIKQACVTLSNEALRLLMHASRSVMKRKQRRRRRRTSTITSSLYKELQSLRNLIPPHTLGDINTEPCVITDAVNYLKLLKQEVKDLNEGLMKTLESNLRAPQDVQVEVMSSGQRLEIHVSCNKRTGLLAELMLVLESIGLIFDDVNASYHHGLLFQACSTQKEVHLLDKQAIRRAVLRAIHKN